MAEYICPNCGKSVYWTPEGDFQSSGWRRLCDECKEVEDAEEAVYVRKD